MHRERSRRELRSDDGRVSKNLYPRCEVDNDIELEPGTNPPTYSLYCMDPIKMEELRKKLKELLEAGHIRPSKSPYGVSIYLERTKAACHVYA